MDDISFRQPLTQVIVLCLFFFCVSVFLSICLSVFLCFVCLRFHPSVNPLVSSCLFIGLSVCLSVFLFASPVNSDCKDSLTKILTPNNCSVDDVVDWALIVHLFVFLCLFLCLSDHLSVYLSVNLSACLSFCFPVFFPSPVNCDCKGM